MPPPGLGVGGRELNCVMAEFGVRFTDAVKSNLKVFVFVFNHRGRPKMLDSHINSILV